MGSSQSKIGKPLLLSTNSQLNEPNYKSVSTSAILCLQKKSERNNCNQWPFVR